jgi:SulP family sulfate permease
LARPAAACAKISCSLRELFPLADAWQTLIKELVSGVIASIVLIANIVSFGALMFSGELSGGIPVVIWAMLIGGCLCGAWIALTTSLPPLATGIDSPTGAVLVLLSATTGAAVLDSGRDPETAILAVMSVFTAATVLTGALLYIVGACRWGAYLRFVPSFVVGGFLAATGCLLAAGAARMLSGLPKLSLEAIDAHWTLPDSVKLAAAVAATVLLVLMRRFVKSPLAMPMTLVALWALAASLLRLLDLDGAQAGWYFRPLGTLKPWMPFAAIRASYFDWAMLLKLIPETFAVTVVALISLVTKSTSIEAIRKRSGDLDRELRSHGLASLIAAPFGGLTSSLQVATSRLCEQIGGTRPSGFVCAAVLGIVGVTNFNLLGLVPIPIIAGLVLYLAYNFIFEAMWRPLSQRAWGELSLIVVLTAACVLWGYLVGVLAGLVCACLLFVISYARLGPVRRHLTCAQFHSHVDRSAEAATYLQDQGDSILIYWLSGYLFFGSSESVFERIRRDIEHPLRRRARFVVLDFSVVSGADRSAHLSLLKLASYCKGRGVALVLSAMPEANLAAMQRIGSFGGEDRHRSFDTLDAAVAWCEDRVLASGDVDVAADAHDFPQWLGTQMGADDPAIADILRYLDRKEIGEPRIIYRQGDPADTIDFVARGQLVVEFSDPAGAHHRLRRITTHSVIGDMGFFRKAARSATVSAECPVILFSLSRDRYRQMRLERPDLACTLADCVMRILAARIESLDRRLAALESIS